MTYALFNGSYISSRNTGIGVVSRDLINNFSGELIRILDPIKTDRYGSIDIPSNLSPVHGMKGHVRRFY